MAPNPPATPLVEDRLFLDGNLVINPGELYPGLLRGAVAGIHSGILRGGP